MNGGNGQNEYSIFVFIMITFLAPNISIATIADIPVITDLLNTAYRGEASKKGWTTEAHLISGNQRTDQNNVAELIYKPGSVFLKYTQEDNQIVGCVNLQQHDNKIYLGMLSVTPILQGAGIGKKLLFAAEEYANTLQCTSIYMSVISIRNELINWYERYGYSDTGERKPFVEYGISGKHLQPMEFMILEKNVSSLNNHLI